MLSSCLLIGFLTAGLADPDSAADAVTLRDGQVSSGSGSSRPRGARWS